VHNADVTASLSAIKRHQTLLRQCTRCPDMTGPAVTGDPVASTVMLIGQAPGPREIDLGKPFAWTAGKTLFSWFAEIGLEESEFRSRVYMTAVCRCFPGKNPRGGDRPPSREEVSNCGRWLQSELRLLQPQLVLPVGKLAIQQFIPVARLHEVVGTQQPLTLHARTVDVIPLPHPSGASTWHRMEPGKSLLQEALRLVAAHPVWQALLRD
jgi:uracil-DNA glycosylase